MSNEELVAEIRAGAVNRLGELWDQVAGLVKWKASRVMTALEGVPGRGVEFDDLYQSGYLAMVAAVESYDPAAGAFSTWLMYHLKKVFADLTGVRTKSGWYDPINSPISMDTPVSDEMETSSLGNLIPDGRASATMEAVEDREYRRQLREALEEALAVLPEHYREILRLRYCAGLTLTEVGEQTGVGCESARKMENRALRVLRQPENLLGLRPFHEYDFYRGSGLAAYKQTGVSVQERYLIREEERRERKNARAITELQADAAAQVRAMTPEEKRRLLEKYGL